MPSETHQTLVLLFCRHPKLSFALAIRAGAPLADIYQYFEDVPLEVDDPIAGTTVRADVALVGYKDDKPRRALLIEVQLRLDLNKEWTIDVYRAGLRRQEHCSAWALVFSPEAKVRETFAEHMFTEQPHLRPQIVTPEMVPPILDLDAALRDEGWAWAVLAVTMHPCGPDAVIGARIAIQAVLRVAPEGYGRYLQLVSTSVGDEIMQQVREQLPVEDREPLSEWERRGSAFTRGRAEGRAEGREEAREAMRATLRTVLDVRGLAIDERTQARIAACADTEELRLLIARAATIDSTAELFH